MFKYTKHTLKKAESLFDRIKYTVRYERGNFQSGYCIVENKRIAVINKFYDIEARINCLIEILGKADLASEEIEALEEKEQELYHQLTEVYADRQETTANPTIENP